MSVVVRVFRPPGPMLDRLDQKVHRQPSFGKSSHSSSKPTQKVRGGGATSNAECKAPPVDKQLASLVSFGCSKPGKERWTIHQPWDLATSTMVGSRCSSSASAGSCFNAADKNVRRNGILCIMITITLRVHAQQEAVTSGLQRACPQRG